MRTVQLAILIFASLALVLSAKAQSVRWEPSSGTLPHNQTTELQLIFEGCEPKEDPAVPAVAGLSLQAVGQSSNMSIVNGRVSQSVTIAFHARATQRATVTIPSFGVTTNKGRITVAPATYQVGDATVGQGNVALDRVANAYIQIPRQVWAGEVFNLEYGLNVARRYFHSPGTNVPDWNPAPLTVEDWGKPEVQETIVSGEQRVAIVYRARAYASAAGEVTLNSASQLVNLTTGSANFGFFSRPNLEQYSISSNRPNLTVRPLPSPAPASFGRAVGDFKLESKVIPANAAVGEPITWTLTLSGVGNWPENIGLPSRDVSTDFRVVQPQARKTMKDGTLFEGTLSEDVVLIPTQPGTYTIGTVTWTYFDPAKGGYQTITTDPVTVTVNASPAPTAPTSAPTPSSSGATPGTDRATAAPVLPTSPEAIPRDALAGSALAPKPMSQRTVWTVSAAALPLIGICWFALAYRRARLTDPVRPRREAHARLQTTLSALRNTKDAQAVRQQLWSWQRDTAILWSIPSAVPAAHHFLAVAGSREIGENWARLWREAERVLYSADRALPSDWMGRAHEALNQHRLPAFSILQTFRARNILPFAASVLLLAWSAPDLNADGRAAYDRGDFPAAESTWRSAIEKTPTDWIARHNLALALAQQNRWGEASGHIVAAFVQNPRDPSVRWHLSLFTQRAGTLPGPLAGFVAENPAHSLARAFSPAEWQYVTIASAALASMGAVVILLSAYGALGRFGRKVGIVVLALAAIGLGCSAVGAKMYAEAADTRAAYVWKPSILRSIPTEVDTTQKTSPLAAGTVAIADKSFLGWSRLVFANGQTGWVRNDDLVWLWR
jgi:tetratricopeptide (TPR) repeat protein